jgi:hypothetical protein
MQGSALKAARPATTTGELSVLRISGIVKDAIREDTSIFEACPFALTNEFVQPA